MTMSFVDIKSSHNFQDIIFKNIQRRKPRLGVKLKGTWERAVIFHGCVLRSKKPVKMVSFQFKNPKESSLLKLIIRLNIKRNYQISLLYIVAALTTLRIPVFPCCSSSPLLSPTPNILVAVLHINVIILNNHKNC